MMRQNRPMNPSRTRATQLVSAAGCVLALLVSGLAEARTYPVPIRSTNEDDLRNLYEDGLLSPEEFDTLLELLNNPIDINKASRGEIYDLPGVSIRVARLIVTERAKSPFRSLNQLAERIEGVDASLIEDIRPFAYAGGISGEDAKFDLDKVSGKARIRTGVYLEKPDPIENDHPNRTHALDQIGYDKMPATQLGAEAVYDRTYGIGFMSVIQPGIQGMIYSPESRDIYADYGQTVDLGRLYGFVEEDNWRVIVGSYSAGFGQGLTFDRTSRTQPNGWYKDVSVSADQLFRKFRFPIKMFGVAGTYMVSSGDVDFETTVFASTDKYNLYQYDMGMTGGEDLDWTQEELDSPRVYVDGQKVGWVTLPDVYRESLVGTNFTLRQGSRNQLGLTTYVGHQDRDVIEGMEDDLQFVIRGGWPVQQDTYGAIGLNGSTGTGPVDFFGEFTSTFTGGMAGQIQALIAPVGGEVELTLRRYGPGFDNPHGRASANADQYLGMRDRDEQGARVRGFYDLTESLRFQADVDLWQNILAGTTNLLTYGRLQWALREKDLVISIYGKRTDQNLAASGRGRVYGGDSETLFIDDPSGGVPDESSESIDLSSAIDRSGTRNFVGTTMAGRPIKPLLLSALYQRMYTDAGLLYPTEEGPCEYDYQIGQYTWFKARWDVVDPTILTYRVRYRDEDVHGSLGEHQLDMYLQWDQKFAERFTFTTRGMVGWQLSDPESDFKDYCDRQGVPELEGTCIADPALLVEEAVPNKPFGVIWAQLQMRF
jgi:hypothetical protein